MFGFDEVEVFWGHRHGFPVEATFEEQGPAGVAGALELGFEFGFEAVVLFGGQVAVAGGVDEGAGGAGAVVEEGFVPAALSL